MTTDINNEGYRIGENVDENLSVNMKLIEKDKFGNRDLHFTDSR